jgi:hypothetical protein
LRHWISGGFGCGVANTHEYNATTHRDEHADPDPDSDCNKHTIANTDEDEHTN